ncbi:Sporulation kinase D [Fusobacterium necrogenes]|uniref:histidine kinase n=1 Tax=Fusobacterium necrogenes TaxID=858 RepID=A0A377GYA6_9FUSO|nr:sensor histidine kinase [Fusobacterium necrogenes]STO31969.1 Sporulation kinase D [Fusobacterium necrogenes]
MKVSKNSLLVRMIFYNDIAIAVSSITIALFLTFTAFQNIESRVIESARDRISLINRVYNGEVLKVKDDLNQTLRTFFAFETRNSENILNYNEKANLVRNQLIRRNYELYSNSTLCIVDENGFVLGKTKDNSIYSKIDKDGFKANVSNADSDIKTSYFSKVEDKIFNRIIVRYNDETNQKLYLVLTLPIDNTTLKNLSVLSSIGERDKIFLLIDDKYKLGTFDLKEDTPILIRRDINKFSLKNYNYIYKKRSINNETYYIALSDIYDYKNDYIGSFGVGIYYENIEFMKLMVSLSVMFIVLVFIILSTTISARMFSKLLEPLGRIVEAAEEVSKGNYKIFVKPEGVDEMRTLSKTFNKMATDIRANEEQSKNKNRKLVGTLKRIDAVEKILMNIQIEDDMNTTVKEIMSALTSEIGLGFSRAMYFRYSREIDTMVGEFATTNNKVKREILNGTDGTDGFKFQIEELNKLVKLIKIPFKNKNLIAKSLIERRIIFQNDKGYKHELGNELFKSLGINNFLIMPIFTEIRNYGCIVVDYFGKENNVTQEEVELLTLLFLNISIRIKNKNLEKEKIDSERTATIGKLVERFFKRREVSFEKILELIKKIYKENLNNDLLKIQIEEIKNEIGKLKREKEILNEYVNVKKNTSLEVVEIETILSDAIEEVEPKLEKLGINLSTFINYNAKILANRARLTRAFYEIIKNAKESFDRKNDNNKKINIIVTKEKNIDKIKISIIDNGIGMSKEQLENIFEPFVGYNENAPGLGLSIVSRIIKDHYGVIKYSSQVDEGTEVKITLNIYKEEIL